MGTSTSRGEERVPLDRYRITSHTISRSTARRRHRQSCAITDPVLSSDAQRDATSPNLFSFPHTQPFSDLTIWPLRQSPQTLSRLRPRPNLARIILTEHHSLLLAAHTTRTRS